MERTIDDKTADMIINCGAFGYSAPKIAAVISWPLLEVAELMEDKGSKFFNLFQQGKHKADYILDLKLFEMAQGGDLKALSEFQKRVKK